MRAWTNGKVCRAWLPEGHLRLDLGDDGAGEFETGPDKKRKQAHAYDDLDLVAPTPKKGKDLLEDYGGPAPIDAVAMDEKTLALVLAEEGKEPELWIGGPKAKKPTLSLSLRAEGTRVAWPEGAIWAASVPPPWSKEAAPVAAGPRSVRLSHNAFGLAIACGATGHLAVLRPGEKTLSFVLRLPGQEEATLHAVATEEGALATLVLDGKHALVLNLAADGSLLGRWPSESFAWGMSASGLLSLKSEKGPQAIVYDSQRESISLLRLPGLEEEQRDHLGDRVVDLAVAPDGKSFALCAEPSIRIGNIDPDTERFLLEDPNSVIALVSFAQSKEATRVPRYDPARATGPARVGFPTIKETGGPWKAKAGESFEISILLRSTGERGEGVVVQVGGPAIDAGHLRITHARAADQDGDQDGEIELDAERRAELPSLRLPQGLVYPLDPKPKKPEDKEVGAVALEATHFEILLRGEALKVGRPLFWVSVGALTAGSSPVKRTRPFFVE